MPEPKEKSIKYVLTGDYNTGNCVAEISNLTEAQAIAVIKFAQSLKDG